MFDISTLITDRTQADVQAWNEKGTYNPSDLNRVTHAMEYLVERIRNYGYSVNYEKVKVPHQPQRGKSRLPAGYTELEYIESTGTQYIDTGFKPNQDTRIVFDASVPKIASTATYVFGVEEWVSGQYFQIRITSTGTTYNSDFGGKANLNTTVTADDSRKIFEVNKNVVTIGGVTVTHGTYTFQCTANLRLLGGITTGGELRSVPGKIFGCQIYDNGTLIRDFVPCTDASGTVGLYDIVNGIFYGNAGTGIFTAGAEVELPSVEILDDYTWYHSDIPQERELTAYLQNVKWLREAMVLYPNTPEVPDDMQGFTFTEANNIEQILVNIETIINLMLSSIIYSGEIFSGEVI